jgi:hypothetical protein
MGIRDTGHRAFTVYYGDGGETLLGRKENRKRKGKIAKRRTLSLVTYRALLGIKPIGSNAEHIVALDADTMDDGTDDGTGLG